MTQSHDISISRILWFENAEVTLADCPYLTPEQGRNGVIVPEQVQQMGRRCQCRHGCLGQGAAAISIQPHVP